jgi:hypothetical protein
MTFFPVSCLWMNFAVVTSPSILLVMIGLYGFVYCSLVVSCLQGLIRKFAVVSAIGHYWLL